MTLLAGQQDYNIEHAKCLVLCSLPERWRVKQTALWVVFLLVLDLPARAWVPLPATHAPSTHALMLICLYTYSNMFIYLF